MPVSMSGLRVFMSVFVCLCWRTLGCLFRWEAGSTKLSVTTFASLDWLGILYSVSFVSTSLIDLLECPLQCVCECVYCVGLNFLNILCQWRSPAPGRVRTQPP